MTETATVTDVAPAEPAAPADAGAEAPPVAAPEGSPTATPPPDVATPDAPAPPEVTREPVPSGVERHEPLSKEAVKQQMRESGSKAPPLLDREGRARDPHTGQFITKEEAGAAPIVPEPGVVPDPATPPDPEASAAGTPPVDQPTDAGAETSSPLFRTTIDADHAVIGMGEAVIETASEGQARVVRALLNGTYRRVQQVEALEDNLAKAEDHIARLESRDVAVSKWEGTPEYTAAVERFHEIKENVGQEAASQFWTGVQHDLKALERSEYQERQRANQAARDKRAGDVWKATAFQNTDGLPQAVRDLPEFRRYFDSAMESFDAELRLGHYPDVKTEEQMHGKFRELFGQRLSRQPDVRAIFAAKRSAQDKVAAQTAVEAENARKATEAAAAAAVQDFKEGVATSRVDNPPNPLGAVGTGQAAGADAPAGPAADAPQPDGAPQTTHSLKKQMRSGARGDAQRRFGR